MASSPFHHCVMFGFSDVPRTAAARLGAEGTAGRSRATCVRAREPGLPRPRAHGLGGGPRTSCYLGSSQKGHLTLHWLSPAAPNPDTRYHDRCASSLGGKSHLPGKHFLKVSPSLSTAPVFASFFHKPFRFGISSPLLVSGSPASPSVSAPYTPADPPLPPYKELFSIQKLS